MDGFLGVGSLEALFVLVLATVVLGPLRMMEALRAFRRLARELRKHAREWSDEIRKELAALDAEPAGEDSPASRAGAEAPGEEP